MDKTYISWSNNVTADIIAETETINALNSNVIRSDDQSFMINVIKELNHTKLVCLSGPYLKSHIVFKCNPPMYDEIEISMPWPSEDSLLYPINYISFHEK